MQLFRRVSRSILDFALPPRCAACGDVLGDAGTFCPQCWSDIDWLGEGCCDRCAIPLEGTQQDVCMACEARPGAIDRTRAAVRYDDLTGSLAIKLKYGRRVGLARAMGDVMARLVGEADNAILVPVPLHRGRLWKRRFNQSTLLARHIGRTREIPLETLALERTRATAAMVRMTVGQRQKNVRGAFRMRPDADIEGKTVILVDDVRTSGATLEACAKTARKAGAARVEAILWARVVRPRDIMRS